VLFAAIQTSPVFWCTASAYGISYSPADQYRQVDGLELGRLRVEAHQLALVERRDPQDAVRTEATCGAGRCAAWRIRSRSSVSRFTVPILLPSSFAYQMLSSSGLTSDAVGPV